MSKDMCTYHSKGVRYANKLGFIEYNNNCKRLILYEIQLLPYNKLSYFESFTNLKTCL